MIVNRPDYLDKLIDAKENGMVKRIPLILMAALMMVAISCDKDDNNDLAVDYGQTSQKLEMTVVVPIHVSSLDYFDYVIRYVDNSGLENKDTIANKGIDLNGEGYGRGYSDGCYIKTFTYDNFPVNCMAYVEMIPRKPGSTMAGFMFYNPKPYIFPNIYHGSVSFECESPNYIMERVEMIRIDDTISTFQVAYGKMFTSGCRVSYFDGEYEYFIY